MALGAGRWLTARAARLDVGTPASQRPIAVTLERTTPRDRLLLFARAHGLSAREGELLERLVTGVDSRDLAAALFISEHTVQDHLKSIFAKTGLHNRRALVSRVSGG